MSAALAVTRPRPGPLMQPRVTLRGTGGGLVRIDGAITEGELNRTMTGASTLAFTVHDPHRRLLRDPMLTRSPGKLGYVDLQFDDIWYRLTKLEKQGDDLTLTFEDRAIAYLRRHTKPRKSSSSSVTLAEFAASLVAEVKDNGGIHFYSPGLHKVQPITTKRKGKKGSTVVQRQKGIPLDRSDLKIRGGGAAPMQLRNANRAFTAAYSLGPPPLAMLALAEALVVENRCQNTNTPNAAGARGILQVLDSTAADLGISATDIEASVNAFLTRGFGYHDPVYGAGRGAIELATTYPNLTAGRIALALEGSGTPIYDQFAGEAQALLDAYNGGAPDVNWASSSTSATANQFSRGLSDGTIEDSWDALVRLAGDANWRCFCDRDTVYFCSDQTLMAAEPVLVVNPEMAAVIDLDFDVDRGKSNLTATLVVNGTRWIAGPGMVVELQGCGPADGRWLIDTIRRPITDPRTEITLTAPGEAPLPPKAGAVTTAVVPDSFTAPTGLTGPVGQSSAPLPPGLTGTTGDPIEQAIAAANAIERKHYPYVWGGGHAQAGTPDYGQPRPLDPRGLIGFDCSGSVGAVLAAAGLGYRLGGFVPGSSEMESWGAAGEGKRLTVYANGVHVFMKIDGRYFSTSSSNPSGGAGWFPARSTVGFVVRHWPGL